MTAAEIEELRFLLILAKMKQNEAVILKPKPIAMAVQEILK